MDSRHHSPAFSKLAVNRCNPVPGPEMLWYHTSPGIQPGRARDGSEMFLGLMHGALKIALGAFLAANNDYFGIGFGCALNRIMVILESVQRCS